MSTAPADEALAAVARVFEDARQRRSARASVAFRTLSRYERRIAKEAAVMGYVLGRRAGTGRSFGDDSDFPKDFEILQEVIEHCDSTSDKFPFLGEACEGRRRRITRARLYDFERAEVTA